MLTLPSLPRIIRYTALSLSPLLMASSAMAAGFTALSGDYYNGYFYGNPSYFTSNTKAFTRQDSFIAFSNDGTSPPYVNWDFTGTPLDGVTDDYSVRWTGGLQVDTAGTYSFQTVSDDGIIVYLDNAEVISNPTEHNEFTNTATLFCQQAPTLLRSSAEKGEEEVRLCSSGKNLATPASAPSCASPLPKLPAPCPYSV